MTFLSVIQNEISIPGLLLSPLQEKTNAHSICFQSRERKYILYCTSGFATVHPFLEDRCIKHPVCRLELARFLVCSKACTPSKEQWLQGRTRAKRSYSTFKVRRGDLVQGKEQQLCFDGAAVKRYPKSEVREIQVRW